MAENGNGKLRAVAWADLLPWLILVRCFRLAIGPRNLLLAAAALALTVSGWFLLDLIFFGPREPDRIPSPAACPWLEVTHVVPDYPEWPRWTMAHLGPAATSGPPVRENLGLPRSTANPLWDGWEYLSRPGRALFLPQQTWRGLLFALFCGLWAVALWAFFGSGIARSAAVQLAGDERVGTAALVKYMTAKWRAYVAAPLLPLAGVLLIVVPFLVAGLIMRVNLGLVLVGLLWPLALLGGLAMTVLLVGLLFGWPLMWCAISTEATDSFEAVSRSYDYVVHRPLQYLFYVVIAGALGLLGWLLVQNFAAAVVGLSYWAAGLGAGQERIALVAGAAAAEGEGLAGLGAAGGTLVRFWAQCVKMIAVGYLFSYFWTASVAVYLLLRRDHDAKEMDEVALDDDETAPGELPEMPTGTGEVPDNENEADPDGGGKGSHRGAGL